MKALARCLVGGAHTRGSRWERECPLRNAAQRSERARKAAVARAQARGRVVEQSGGVGLRVVPHQDVQGDLRGEI